MNQQTDAMSVGNKELILARAQQGDQEALSLLFESRRRRLFASALRILPRPQDAEDAVQEAMMKAYAHLDQYRGRSDSLTWVTRIVINAAVAQIRRARCRPVVSSDQTQTESDETVWSEFIEDPKLDPEEIYQQVEHRRLLRDALRTVKGHLHPGRAFLVRKLRSKSKREGFVLHRNYPQKGLGKFRQPSDPSIISRRETVRRTFVNGSRARQRRCTRMARTKDRRNKEPMMVFDGHRNVLVVLRTVRG